MLSISGLCKTYGSKKAHKIRALDKVNLSIGPGMFGLLGPNGAGKSSLMRTIATLQKPDEGCIEFAGKNIVSQPEFMRSQLGYLPQEYGVYAGVSAYVLLDYLAKLKGIESAQQRRFQVESLLAQVNLSEHKNKAVSQYSGGMKQRFGIAQALLGNPQILIVDEPTAGLDPEERNRFHNLLVDISADKVVLLSTHIVEDVRHLCPNLAIMANGKVVKQGRPQQLTEAINGKVWQLKADKSEITQLKSQHNVISQRFLAGEVSLRVLSDSSPGATFEQVQPDLEDAYFAALSTQSMQGVPHHD